MKHSVGYLAWLNILFTVAVSLFNPLWEH